MGQIGFSVAVPLLGFALLGRYIDNYFNTGGPYFFLGGIAIATFLIYFIIKKIVTDTLKKLEKINKE